MQRYLVLDKQFSHFERHGEHGDSQQHKLGLGPGIGEQEEDGIGAQVSEYRLVRGRLRGDCHRFTSLISFRRRSYPARADSEGRDKPIRFAVRSLGWTEIAEEDLTPERSSKAVNKCIVDLSLGRNDLLDVVGRWGDVSSFRN